MMLEAASLKVIQPSEEATYVLQVAEVFWIQIICQEHQMLDVTHCKCG